MFLLVVNFGKKVDKHGAQKNLGNVKRNFTRQFFNFDDLDPRELQAQVDDPPENHNTDEKAEEQKYFAFDLFVNLDVRQFDHLHKHHEEDDIGYY